MNALILAAVFALPPQSVLPPPQAVSISAASCPCGGDCGPGCPCGDGECRNVDFGRSPSVLRPHLTVTVADRGCPPCDRFERDELPRLVRRGWRVDVRRVPFGSATTPAFELRSGSKWEGYTSVVDFEARLAPSKPAARRVAVPSLNTKPVSYLPAGYHSHRCNSCGTVWSHSNNGGSHRCPNCGRSQYVIYQRGGTSRGYSAPMRSGCSSGNCGRSSGGFFRGLFR